VRSESELERSVSELSGDSTSCCGTVVFGGDPYAGVCADVCSVAVLCGDCDASRDCSCCGNERAFDGDALCGEDCCGEFVCGAVCCFCGDECTDGSEDEELPLALSVAGAVSIL